MTKSIHEIIKLADEAIFKSLVESAKGSCKTDEDVVAFVSNADVPRYKKAALLEYADKNKDLLLAMDTHTEMQPITATDDIAPVAVVNGKVKNSVENDAELTAPEEIQEPNKHPSHTQQVDEHKCFVILEDGSLEKVIVEDVSTIEALIMEHFGQKCIVVFEEIQDDVVLTEAEMTDAQKAKREEIVTAMKKHSRELQKRYGAGWESVMYAIATKSAMKEDDKEPESSSEAGAVSESVNSEIVHTETAPDGSTLEISKVGEYFVFKHVKNGEVVDVQEFSNQDDAMTALGMVK